MVADGRDCRGRRRPGFVGWSLVEEREGLKAKSEWPQR